MLRQTYKSLCRDSQTKRARRHGRGVKFTMRDKIAPTELWHPQSTDWLGFQREFRPLAKAGRRKLCPLPLDIGTQEKVGINRW